METTRTKGAAPNRSLVGRLRSQANTTERRSPAEPDASAYPASLIVSGLSHAGVSQRSTRHHHLGVSLQHMVPVAVSRSDERAALPDACNAEWGRIPLEESSMARRVLESLRGVGEVYAGEVLLRKTRYELSVWLEDDSSTARHSQATVVDGHIDITGMSEAVVLAGPGELTLRLQDGRRLQFLLTGSGGAITGRGGLQSAT